ncbi:hypothetical protein CC117_25330 [Parafrankia colletiae]|uniref:Uncharacterized protein n=1 Tax=Parafrankia colletiae TaxID=573497 RepID=A0A1S1QFE0_9ACTN|nr:hypothetical protein CC117_25330 [Parafrankia colletiae]
MAKGAASVPRPESFPVGETTIVGFRAPVAPPGGVEDVGLGEAVPAGGGVPAGEVVAPGPGVVGGAVLGGDVGRVGVAEGTTGVALDVGVDDPGVGTSGWQPAISSPAAAAASVTAANGRGGDGMWVLRGATTGGLLTPRRTIRGVSRSGSPPLKERDGGQSDPSHSGE